MTDWTVADAVDAVPSHPGHAQHRFNTAGKRAFPVQVWHEAAPVLAALALLLTGS